MVVMFLLMLVSGFQVSTPGCPGKLVNYHPKTRLIPWLLFQSKLENCPKKVGKWLILCHGFSWQVNIPPSHLSYRNQNHPMDLTGNQVRSRTSKDKSMSQAMCCHLEENIFTELWTKRKEGLFFAWFQGLVLKGWPSKIIKKQHESRGHFTSIVQIYYLGCPRYPGKGDKPIYIKLSGDVYSRTPSTPSTWKDTIWTILAHLRLALFR